MITFSNTVHINRPIGEVYAYLSDLEHTPEWNWAITRTQNMTPGPTKVGTRYRQTRSAPQPATELLEVTALANNQLIEVQGTLARLPARLSYRLDERDAGTDLTNTVKLETTGALRLLEPALARRIKRAVADNLNQLQTRLETQQEPPKKAHLGA